MYAMTKISYCRIDNHIVIQRLQYNTFILFEKNRNVLYAFQEFCIAKRKETIIKELALITMYCGEKYDEDACLQKYNSDDKEYFYSLLKNSKLSSKQAYKATIKKVFATQGLPAYFYQFKDFYTGQMLKSKNTIGEILLSAFSIIIEIVSLVSINAFSLLSFKVWGILISGFLVEIVDSTIFWKTTLMRYVNALSRNYDELKEVFDEFLASKERPINNIEINK